MFYEAQLIQNFKFFQAENLVQCVPLRESIQIRSFTDVKLIKGSFDKEIMDIFKKEFKLLWKSSEATMGQLLCKKKKRPRLITGIPRRLAI